MAGGQGRPPTRELRLAFLGAGASRATGLPLTSELVSRVHPTSGTPSWSSVRSASAWEQVLSNASRVLFADGDAPGYRPNVGDLFTTLDSVARIGKGFARVPLDAASLLADLRKEIARGLLREAHALDMRATPHYLLLDRPDRPHVVVTSNWDDLVELAADAAKLRVHYTWPRNSRGIRRNLRSTEEIVVLKLHGSVDWGLARDRAYGDEAPGDRYANLETSREHTTRFGRGPIPSHEVLRYRLMPNPDALGFNVPFIATMAVGKSAHIDLLRAQWSDAHYSLSRAKLLRFYGYSFPSDDLEIRALLRLGTRATKGAGAAPGLGIGVQDPDRQAHSRARDLLGMVQFPDYTPLGGT